MFSQQVIINDILPYTQATLTAGQTVIGTNWTANAASDVVVYYTPFGDAPDDATQQLTSDEFSVAFIGGSQQVQVTLVTPANQGDVATVIRNTPADRLNLYTNTNFTPSMLNQDFGILTLVDQQAQLVNQLVGPRYNYSADITPVVDTILPILGENETWVMNSSGTGIITYTLPQSGIAPADDTYVLLTPDSALPNSIALSSLQTGFMVNSLSGNTIITTTFAGMSNQIGVSNANGIGGATVISIVNNPIIPGTAGMGIPEGTTAQRVTPVSNISFRYNTTLGALEYYAGSWIQLIDDVVVQPGLINELAWYAASGQSVSGLATLDNGVLVTSASGAPEWLANSLTPGYVLTANSGAPASWQAVSVTGAITTIDGDSGSATPASGVVTISGGTTGLTISGSGSILDLTGTLIIGNGGTGKTSVTIAPTASAWAGWDTNKNFSANSLIEGYTTTATAGSTTTLTVSSTYLQYFTGSANQINQMPVTSTLVLGQQWRIVNLSTGTITIESSGGNTIQVMAAGSNAVLTCILTSGTSAASWDCDYSISAGASGTVNAGLINQLAWYASSGTAVSGLATANSGVLVTSAGGVPSISTTLPNGLAMGTPASITLTNGTGLPISTGILNWAAPTQTLLTTGTAQTYTTPANVKWLRVRGWAGGGGAGGAATSSAGQAAGSTGGGGGGYFEKIIDAPSATYTYTVAAAANGGAAGANPGTGGNLTSFGSLTANGGSGGNAGSATAGSGIAAAPVAGGTASGGDLNVSGGYSTPAVLLPAGGVAALSAGGGSHGTPTVNTTGVGVAAVNGNFPGGGGSGVATGASSQLAGGNGAAGYIIVEEHYI